MISLASQLDWTLRLMVALLCGGAIGYERSRQFKSAGIRTHIVVAVGAALITIASKYGFADIIMIHNISLDPSRIAAQIVSGIGFIGAGMILTGRTKVSGLTTAAGIWATAAIGMTIGCGLYIIGIIAAILIVTIQFLFHDDSLSDWILHDYTIRLQIRAANKSGVLKAVQQILLKDNIKHPDISVISVDENDLYLKASGLMNDRITSMSRVMLDLNQCKDIIQIRYSRR